MIDPLEVMVVYLAAQMGSQVAGRVAAKHRFGTAWTVGQAAIVVHPDGGSPDLYAPIQQVRFELDFYGADTPEILALWGTVVALSRAVNRNQVTVSGGAALLQSFTQASGPSLLYDEEIKADFGMAFFEAIIAEEPVISNQ
uniref:Tail protein n=2 Tax=viral metagenome TaxID=1070528 RepID=A0A6M3XDZ0_9ZZZZ